MLFLGYFALVCTCLAALAFDERAPMPVLEDPRIIYTHARGGGRRVWVVWRDGTRSFTKLSKVYARIMDSRGAMPTLGAALALLIPLILAALYVYQFTTTSSTTLHCAQGVAIYPDGTRDSAFKCDGYTTTTRPAFHE